MRRSLLKLNIGAGLKKKEGFVNIDSNPKTEPDVVRDIRRGLPYDGSTVDLIECDHLIEHLNPEDFIFFFNECHRVLVDGGKLIVRAPYYQGKWAFIDPTHIRYITEHSFDFFVNKDYNSTTAGVTGWYEPESTNVNGGEITVVMKKVLSPTKFWEGVLKDGKQS